MTIPDGILILIKIIAISQSVLLLALLLLAYGLKRYLQFKKQNTLKRTAEIRRLWAAQLRRVSVHILPYQIKWYRKNQKIVVDLVKEFDTQTTSHTWPILRKILLESVILPNARRDALAWRWEKRYLACSALQCELHSQDLSLVQSLIADAVPIVAIRAAVIAMQYNAQILVDTVITHFAKGRHVQQSLYAQLVTQTGPDCIDFVHARLLREKNVYVKIFCYRLLRHLKKSIKPVDLALTDVYSTHLDLRIAALQYLVRHAPLDSAPLCMGLLSDTTWQMRAAAVKLIGEMKISKATKALARCLRDENWWVRINVAEALLSLGAPGLAVLEQQNKEQDRYAYDAARKRLLTRGSTHD